MGTADGLYKWMVVKKDIIVFHCNVEKLQNNERGPGRYTELGVVERVNDYKVRYVVTSSWSAILSITGGNRICARCVRRPRG